MRKLLAVCIIIGMTGMTGCASYDKEEMAYRRGRGDAVKEQYWRIQAETGEGSALSGDSGELVFYNVRIPKGAYSPDGRVLDEHWVSIPVVE